jgi:hypothetical protein
LGSPSLALPQKTNVFMTTSRKIPGLKLGLFAALSLVDLGMTWLLLEHSHGRIYEGNPIAAWCLARCGWAGLAGFKLGLMLLVGGLVVVIASRRPRAAGRFLTLACLLVGGVVLHSWTLTAEAAGRPNAPDVSWEKTRARRLQRHSTIYRAYSALMDRLGDEVLADRRTLEKVVEELAESVKGRSPEWRKMLQEAYPGRSLSACFAISFSEYAVGRLCQKPIEANRLAALLRAQFEAHFTSEPPWAGWDGTN